MENALKVKKKRLSREARDNITGYGLIAPALVALIVIGVVPILITVSYSFQYYVLTDPLNQHFVGLENYITLFKNPLFWRILGNTMLFAVLSMLFQLVLGFAGAILMSKAMKATGLVRTAVLIPWAIPGIIIAYTFSYMFNDQMGVLNSILIASGVSETGVSMLTSSAGAMLVVVLADTWKQFPYVALMLMAGLQTIPEEYYEAASIDGAAAVLPDHAAEPEGNYSDRSAVQNHGCNSNLRYYFRYYGRRTCQFHVDAAVPGVQVSIRRYELWSGLCFVHDHYDLNPDYKYYIHEGSENRRGTRITV